MRLRPADAHLPEAERQPELAEAYRLQDEFLLRQAAPNSIQAQARFREAKAFLEVLGTQCGI